MPRPVSHSFYDTVVVNIHRATKSVCEYSTKRVIEEGLTAQFQQHQEPSGLTVFGDSTNWRKKGFSSLFGVATLLLVNGKKLCMCPVRGICQCGLFLAQQIGISLRQPAGEESSAHSRGAKNGSDQCQTIELWPNYGRAELEERELYGMLLLEKW
ncbi:hypothetical protein J437_LFUL005507 [Ladona fulva]|uniref:Uncharacterized protein n=1 Tax=Ladona fulva TaxID=123851 RepID=A0A8K0K2Y2_LADFU|nr:hypothetical protein J437_LFUL005507 [Ladona fulva]